MADFRLSKVDWRNALLPAASLLLLCLSCSHQAADNVDSAGTPLVQSAQDGPVRLSLSIVPNELPFDQKAVLTVEAVSEKGVPLELDDYQAAVADAGHQFELRLRKLSHSSAAPTPDGKLRWTQRYEIEFFLPGEYELPPAKLKYAVVASAAVEQQEKNVALPADSRELMTETIKVVAKPTASAELGPEELKKIQVLPPVELKDPWSRWWLAAIPAGLFAAAAIVLLLRRRAREAAVVAEVVPAHEWARRQIAALVADDLIAKGQVQEFYYRISAIVRGYIERRFGVSAPEMTTEEFLAATAGDFRFSGGPADDLQPFMTACDLVKYARQQPAAGEWNQMLRTASDFVERTRERPLPEAQPESALQEAAS